MPVRQRSVFRSAVWAYALCFAAGGATIALATFAFRNGAPLPSGSAQAGETVKVRLNQRVAVAGSQGELKAPDARSSSARHAAQPAAKIDRNVAVPPVLIARVSASEPVVSAQPVAQTEQAIDSDADEGLSAEPWAPVRSDTFRTVCVRLCDGSSTPISFATTRDRFKADAAKCTAGCSSPTRLFYAKAGTTELDDMIDVHGAPYADLPTAFQFRSSYDASCTCRGQPWETASKLRHLQFAAAAAVDGARQSHMQQKTSQTLAKVAGARETLGASGEKPGVEVADGAGQTDKRSVMSALPVPPATNAAPSKRLTVAAAIKELPLANGAGRSPYDAQLPGPERLPQPAVRPPSTATDGITPEAAKSAERAGGKGSKVSLVSRSPAVAKTQSGAVASRRASEARAVRQAANRSSTSTGTTSSRDILVSVRGNARAQREFRTQDYWRLSYWEPR